MNVAIVDHDPFARAVLRRLLQEQPDFVIVFEGDGRGDTAAISRKHPDVLLIDPAMPGEDGFAVLESVRRDILPAVIFVTAEEGFAVRAFEMSAVDFLVKPLDRGRFFRTLARAREHVRNSRRHAKYYLVPAREKMLFIRTADIDWIGPADNYVALHVGGERHLLRRTLSEIERELDPRTFVRVHRSAIVNVHRLKELYPMSRGVATLVLMDGTHLPLGRDRWDEFEKRLGLR